jgi:hypothetical protein
VDALPESVTLVSGGAEGVDAIAEARARLRGLEVEVIRPDYGAYPHAATRYAPIVGNEEIVRLADEVVVFWDGVSKGSRSVIEFAKRQGKPLTVRVPGGATAEDEAALLHGDREGAARKLIKTIGGHRSGDATDTDIEDMVWVLLDDR